MPLGLTPTMNLGAPQVPALNIVPPQLPPMEYAPNLQFDLNNGAPQGSSMQQGGNQLSLAPFSQHPFVFYPENTEEPAPGQHVSSPSAAYEPFVGTLDAASPPSGGGLGPLDAEMEGLQKTRDVSLGDKKAKKKSLSWCFC